MPKSKKELDRDQAHSESKPTFILAFRDGLRQRQARSVVANPDQRPRKAVLNYIVVDRTECDLSLFRRGKALQVITTRHTMPRWKALLPKRKLFGRNDDPSLETTNAKVVHRSKTYQYAPLDPKRSDFRVLLLSTLDSKGCLSGTLRTVSMLDNPKPEYKTVSYAWGDTTSSCSILIDGKPLEIPTSAYQALDGVLRDGYQGAVWIDSVCINQADRQEREQQISMMGGEVGIYSNGRLNIIWLGESDASTAKAIEAMKLVLEDMRKATGNNFERLSKTVRDPVTHEDLFSEAPFLVDFKQGELLKYFERAWFRRL